MELKKQVEAILFTLGKFVSVDEIARHAESSSEDVIKVLEELKGDYEKKDSSLSIHQQDNLFKLNIKKEFGFLTNKLLEEKDMDSPTTKTLAVIAYKSPISQSEIIKIRGNKAYDHIKHLKDSGLISSDKQGRTRLLKLTSHFYDYFDISEKEVKEQLSKVIPSNFKIILDELPKLS
ncbi:MAG: SMC-Scp complex subunit ScpB [Candidatus Woesearchaeota archaeon]